MKGEVKASVAELRADLHKADSAHKSWILATVLSVLGTGIAIVAVTVTLLRNQPTQTSQSVAPTSQPPVIINNIPPQQPVQTQPASAKKP